MTSYPYHVIYVVGPLPKLGSYCAGLTPRTLTSDETSSILFGDRYPRLKATNAL